MTPDELEAAYDLIAEAIDALPPERESLFLAKLALALANACDDVETVRGAVGEALRNLD